MRRREDGEREVRGRAQAGANAWRAVEGVMADRRHAHLCDTGMPVRNGNFGTDRTTTTKAASVRKKLGTREETGVQRSLTERLVRSRLQWAGLVERMADDRLPKIAAELRKEGRRRRGRPRLRWEDCVKRDVKKAGEEEDWKKKT